MNCAICHHDFMDSDRVIFSARDTFVFKPADVPDEPETVRRQDGTLQKVSAAATLSPEALRDRRKDHLRTAVVNVFVDWGKADVPAGAFYFRHQGCEPQRTGAGLGLHPVNKHAIRFGRAAPGRMNG